MVGGEGKRARLLAMRALSKTLPVAKTHTWMLLAVMTALGVRAASKSDSATKAPTTKATVVKKPNVFWPRMRVLYMMVREGRRRAAGVLAQDVFELLLAAVKVCQVQLPLHGRLKLCAAC